MVHTGSVECCHVLFGEFNILKNIQSERFGQVLWDAVKHCEILQGAGVFSKVLNKFFEVL